jgi:hypothetical protein
MLVVGELGGGGKESTRYPVVCCWTYARHQQQVRHFRPTCLPLS